METAVSVALCTHNGARFVAAQVRSILSQTLPVAELVLSDDASSDATLDIVRATLSEAADDGIDLPAVTFLVNQSAVGVTANFALAVTACSHPLIVLSDQDDVWHQDRIARAVREFDRRPELTLLNSDGRIVDETGESTGSTLFDALELSAADRRALHGGEAFDVLIKRNVVTGATTMLRRDLLETALPFPDEWVHDEWLAILASAMGCMDFVEEPLIDYRRHGNNQIGVREPTLRHKIGRVLEPRGTRNVGLALRSRILAERLEALGTGVREDAMQKARAKARLETFRAYLPSNRAKRIMPVMREAIRGTYGKYASQGRLDILRDLFQPDLRSSKERTT